MTSLEAAASSLDACNSSLREARALSSAVAKRLGDQPPGVPAGATGVPGAGLPGGPGSETTPAVDVAFLSRSDLRMRERAVKEAWAAEGEETAVAGWEGRAPSGGWKSGELPAAAAAGGGGEGVRMEELRGRRKLALPAREAKDWKKEGFLM